MNLKDLQEHLFALTLEFDSMCRSNNIQYTLHGGSLLGAIREKGFIPWDDDVDVAMTRDEFEKLRTHLQNSNGEYYIRGNIKKQFCKKNNPAEWIDIFICDFIKPTGFAFKLKENLLTVLDVMNRDKNSIKLSNFSNYGIGKRIVFKTMFFCGQIIPKRIKASCYERISKNCFLGDKKYMIRSNDQLSGRMKKFPAEWMNDYLDVPFASAKLKVIQKYHELLVDCYGKNYMTPVKDNRNHDIHEIVRTIENNL